jgi:regulator of replication initiation timing
MSRFDAVYSMQAVRDSLSEQISEMCSKIRNMSEEIETLTLRNATLQEEKTLLLIENQKLKSKLVSIPVEGVVS